MKPFVVSVIGLLVSGSIAVSHHSEIADYVAPPVPFCHERENIVEDLKSEIRSDLKKCRASDDPYCQRYMSEENLDAHARALTEEVSHSLSSCKIDSTPKQKRNQFILLSALLGLFAVFRAKHLKTKLTTADTEKNG